MENASSSVGWRTVGFLGLEVDALDRATINRGRQEVDDGVEERLNALVLERRAAENRVERATLHGGTNEPAQGSIVRLRAVQVGHHGIVVHLDRSFDQLAAILDSLILQLGRDLFFAVGSAESLAVPDDRLHLDEVDHALEVALRADRQLKADGLAGHAVDDVGHALEEVGAGLVHLVDEHDTRNVVLVGLAPDGLGLGLDTLVAVENADGAVEHAQRTLDFDGEVDVAGGVDDVQALVVPEAGGGSGRDRDATLLLLLHPVHGGGTLVHFTDLVGLSGVVKDALGRGGLAGIDVGHDAEIPVVLNRVRAGHRSAPQVRLYQR